MTKILIFSNIETEECFDDIMSEDKNYDRVQEFIEDAILHDTLTEEEQVGYITAYLESFVRSDFFKTSMSKVMIEEVACDEIVRYLYSGEAFDEDEEENDI